MKYKMLMASLALLFVLTVAPAYGEVDDDVYYCVDTDANGFFPDKEKDSYQRSGFNGDRFKMKLDLSNKKIELAMGSKGRTVSYICTQPFFPESTLSCYASFRMFNFNYETGRYVSASGYGYLKSTEDAVSVSIGTCNKF
jgi:hypothetical protein